MKKFILISTALFLLLTSKTTAQTICDSISINAAYVDATSLNITVYNSSHHFIAYPFFTANLDANPYITVTSPLMIPTFLSVPTDASLGYTSGMFFATVAPEVSVPLNTLFTGTLTIEDPNDSTFSCNIPFSFQYGMMIAGLEESNTTQMQLFPNPTSGEFSILLAANNAEVTVTDLLGKVILTTATADIKTNLALEENGIYMVYVLTNQGTTKRKLIVNH